jgi:hypothetical protein
MSILGQIALACLLVLPGYGGETPDCMIWKPLFPESLGFLFSAGEATVFQVGVNRADSACVMDRHYYDLSTGADEAMISIYQGTDYYRMWGLYLIANDGAGTVPTVTRETIAGQTVLLDMTKTGLQPPSYSLSFSPKERFLLVLTVKSPVGKPAIGKKEMLEFGAMLPLAKFAEMSAKMR